MTVNANTTGAALEVEPIRLEYSDAYAPELELLTRRWTLQILVVLLQRPARFSEFLRTIPGLSKNVMVERLRELGEAGLVARHVDPGPPVTTTYSLTPDGEALRPHIEGVLAWAAKRRAT
jgi:DNA-binding HxlR family transcriptional regulator